MQVGDSLIGWVAKNRQPVNIAQFDRDTRHLKLYRRDEGIKAFLAVPVGEDGVLCIDSKRNYVFTEKHQKILQDFSLIVLMALEMEGVSQLEKRQTRILNFLYQINDLSREGHPLPDYYLKVLKRCREFSNTDAAFIALVPKKGDRYKVVASEGKLRAPLKKPLIRPVMKARQHSSYVFFPEDPCRHFQAYMGLPLHFFRKVYGVMNLIGYQENHWEEDEIRALLFAGQIIITTILSLMDS
jgi:signal transduction protein with GAF and PtsI domain